MDEVMDTEDSLIQFSLSDFPDEILLKLMGHMNDTSLLNMTRTCHRFRAIAKEAFGKLYNGESNGDFNLKILCENGIEDQKRYQPFLCTFGENIKSIEITFDDFQPVNESHWVYDSMRMYCQSLKKLRISYGDGVDLTKILLQVPSITHLSMFCSKDLNYLWTMHSFPNLKSLFLFGTNYANQGRNIGKFFDKNRQLTELSIEQENDDAFNIIDLLNGKLNDLKLLDVNSPFATNMPNLKSTVFTLHKLESVALSNAFSSYALLDAISKGCKNITELDMWSESDDIEWNEAVSTICSLRKLTKLKINAYNIETSHIQQVMEGLPNLRSLHFHRISQKSTAFKSLPEIIPSGTELTKFNMTVLEPNDFISVNSDFIKYMAEFTQLNKSLKVLLISYRDNFVFTQGEVRRNNSIIYCSKQESYNHQSTLNLLDLLDPCLEKIVGLLDAKSQCALYDSCTKMQRFVKVYMSSHIFRAKARNIDESFLQSLGMHISRISVENSNHSSNQDAEVWRNISRYCPTITEIITTGSKLNTNNHALLWPNLKKLIIENRPAIDYQNLRSFVCPMLEHLEIRLLADNGGAVQAINKFDHGDQYRQLTTLKFRCYNEATVKFLLGLDDTICQQVRVLALYNISDSEWKSSTAGCRKQKRTLSQLVNILIRFRNLTTLEILVPGVSTMNTQYLFENCTKLVNFELCHDMHDDVDIFLHLKANCKQIQFIRVIEPPGIYGYEEHQLQKVQKILPGIKIQIDKTKTFLV